MICSATGLPQRTRSFTRYRELLKLSYPIHPELYDRLSKDWASLEKFQRTRGVLRFMANVVGTLWQAQVSDPLITPARVPIAHERVRASVLYPLDAKFNAVVDKEVDGDGSLPAQIEAAQPTRRIARDRAVTPRRARRVRLLGALCWRAERGRLQRAAAPRVRRAGQSALRVRGGDRRAGGEGDLPLRGGGV